MKRYEEQQSNRDIEFDKLKHSNIELQNTVSTLETQSKELVSLDKLYESRRSENLYKSELESYKSKFQREISLEVSARKQLESQLKSMKDYDEIKQELEQIKGETFSYLKENERNKHNYLEIESKYSDIQYKYGQKADELK